jgi:hypothetical protein
MAENPIPKRPVNQLLGEFRYNVLSGKQLNISTLYVNHPQIKIRNLNFDIPIEKCSSLLYLLKIELVLIFKQEII